MNSAIPKDLPDCQNSAFMLPGGRAAPAPIQSDRLIVACLERFLRLADEGLTRKKVLTFLDECEAMGPHVRDEVEEHIKLLNALHSATLEE